mgnify:FL=1
MRFDSTPVLVSILEWIVIVRIPATFFFFGWKDFELYCQRQISGALPACTISESFGMGLYTRRVSTNNILRIGYKTGTARQASTKTGMVTMHPSTMIFDTTGGEVRIGHVSSAVDHSVERELILKTRAFLDAPDALDFRYEASMHGMFGYVGLVGVAGLLFIFFSVLWHHLRKAISRR